MGIFDSGGGDTDKSKRTLADAVRYAQGLSGTYTDVGRDMYSPAMKRQAHILRSDWAAPMRGAQQLALEQSGDAAARGGIAGSGMAAAQTESINNQWAQDIANQNMAIKQGKLQGNANLAQMGSANALNWADFVNRMRLAQSGGALQVAGLKQAGTGQALGSLGSILGGAGNLLGGIAQF